MSTLHIPVDKIIPNPQQPRREFDPTALQELADSIKVNGLVQPITVRQASDGDYYILVSGERRLRAHKLIERTTIEAVVRPPSSNAIVGERELLVQALIENVQRQDLNPIEEAVALAKLRNMNYSHKQLSGWTGLSAFTITNRLKLLELEEDLQELIAEGTLPRDPRVTDALLSIKDSEARVKLGQRLARPGITISAIQTACKRLKDTLEAPVVVRQVGAPALALMTKTPPATQTQRWQNVQAAAAGMCAKCSSNPQIPGLPHPAWAIITQAAEETCQACPLRESAYQNNLTICRDCPAVDLLQRMMANA